MREAFRAWQIATHQRLELLVIHVQMRKSFRLRFQYKWFCMNEIANVPSYNGRVKERDVLLGPISDHLVSLIARRIYANDMS